MKLCIDFGHWTATKAAIAVAGALAIGGAVGSAVAISPVMPAPVKWQGGVNIVKNSLPAGNQVAGVYTVPTGRNLMITDIVIANGGNTTAFGQIIFTAATTGCTGSTSDRTSRLTVPAADSLDVPLVTGIGVAAGQTVCLLNTDTDSDTHWTVRGYLFTAAPAS